MDGEKGGRGTLKVLKNTTIFHPSDGSSADIIAGRELPVLAWKQENDRILFTLDDESIQERNTWLIASSVCDFTRANPEVKVDKVIGRIDVIELPRIGRASLQDSIITNGSFTWAEATHEGTRIPPNQQTFDSMVCLAHLAQTARDRLGKPMRVTSWYRTPQANRACGGAKNSRHLYADALDFTVEGITGEHLYHFLDPWWPGGLGMYPWFPHLCHIDARGYRARWGAE